jgi:D-alanyl-D-alanine carboxypeptidase (penicillin-binding protein 5/6)
MLRLILLTTSLLLTTLQANAAAVVPAPPNIAADAYLLIDYDSGKILVEHNIDERLPPASLTKLMTAYILAEEIDAGRLSLDDQVPVSRNAWSQNPTFRGSSLMWIEPGLPVTVRELERGIVISSGNDATVAIAEHIAGSEDAFAGMMNSYAELLGMDSTYYVNSHGLPNPEHLTTARDLATLAIATIRNHPERYKVYREQSYTYNDITQYNRNHLLREDDSVDGLKTGYTSEAGYGLVASAERDGMRLVSVVMGSASTRSRKAETRALLNYGFRFYQTITPVLAESALAQGKVWKGAADQLTAGLLETAVMTVPRTRVEPEVSVELSEPLVAPIARGDSVGTVRIVLGEEVVGEYPLLALEDIPEAGFFARLWDGFMLWLTSLFG